MPPRNAIRIAATGARAVIGATVAVVCVLGVTAGVALPWPTVTRAPAQVSVTPTPGDTVLVCNGAFRALGQNIIDVAQMSSAGAFSLIVDSNDAPDHIAELETPDLVGSTAAPRVLTGFTEHDESRPIAAAESISLSDEGFYGLAAAPCRQPSTESWLIGGEVETGTSDIITIANPGAVNASVTLTVYGLESTSSTMVVPANSQIAVPLAAHAAGLQQPVVRVTAEGSPVRAVLQSSLVRTLDPSGIDVQDTAGAPAPDLTFAAVQVVAASADTPTTVLRMLATDASTEATVTVRAAGDGGAVQQLTVPLDAGVPVEVNLDGLARGVYSVDVSARAPIVGAIWQSTGDGAGSDFAWMTPAPEISDDVLFAVPAGPSPRLHIVNGGTAEATIALTRVGASAPRDIVIPPGASEVVALSSGANYLLTTTAPVHAAVSLTGADAIAGWPVWPGAGALEPITVYP